MSDLKQFGEGQDAHDDERSVNHPGDRLLQRQSDEHDELQSRRDLAPADGSKFNLIPSPEYQHKKSIQDQKEIS